MGIRNVHLRPHLFHFDNITVQCGYTYKQTCVSNAGLNRVYTLCQTRFGNI